MQLAGIMSPDSPTKSPADGGLRGSFQLAFRFLFQEKTRAAGHRDKLRGGVDGIRELQLHCSPSEMANEVPQSRHFQQAIRAASLPSTHLNTDLTVSLLKLHSEMKSFPE
ncbi:uncharacterized [Tachysurus ichikawai]